MARVILKDKNATVRGALCGLIYKYRNGTQYVYMAAQPKTFRGRIVYQSVAKIQRYKLERTDQKGADMQRIADEYQAIKKAVERMYEAFEPVIGKKFDKLVEAIVYWYCYKRVPPELDFGQIPEQVRKDIDEGGRN